MPRRLNDGAAMVIGTWDGNEAFGLPIIAVLSIAASFGGCEPLTCFMGQAPLLARKKA